MADLIFWWVGAAVSVSAGILLSVLLLLFALEKWVDIMKTRRVLFNAYGEGFKDGKKSNCRGPA